MSYAIRYDGKKDFTDEQVIQSLDRPGAGIPYPARLALRFILKPFVVRRITWAECETQILKNHAKILREIKDLDFKIMTTRALVPFQPGLEDSSRYWSIAMVLRHLIIVGQGVEYSLIKLGKNEDPQIVVDTAQVKPENQTYDPSIILDYQKFTEGLILRVKNSFSGDYAPIKTDRKLFHPWFGEMNAKDWFWLIGMHMGLHLKQMREIKKAIQLYQQI